MDGVVDECHEGEEGEQGGEGVDGGRGAEVGQLHQGKETDDGVVEVDQTIEDTELESLEEGC